MNSSSETRVWVESQLRRAFRDFDRVVVLQEAKPFISDGPRVRVAAAAADSAAIGGGGGGVWEV